MRVLALDTCLNACQAAVIRDGAPLAVLSETMSRGHQERLAPMVRDVMAQAGLGFGDLDLIAVTVGPGSFTGLRVGLAFAKGLALALGRPCVGVGTLEALAAGAAEKTPCVAVIDAGRGRVFIQTFGPGPARGQPGVMDLEVAHARLLDAFGPEAFTLIGPGAPLIADRWPACKVDGRSFAEPVAIARLAAAARQVRATPLYLRAPDAIPKRLSAAG